MKAVGTSTAAQYTELHRFLKEINEPMDAIWLNFWDYHLLHQSVMESLYGLAMSAIHKGLKRYGISPIWEVLRWTIRVTEGRTEEFKCSNSYRSRYARYMMWKYQNLAGFFELRPLRTGGGPEWK